MSEILFKYGERIPSPMRRKIARKYGHTLEEGELLPSPIRKKALKKKYFKRCFCDDDKHLNLKIRAKNKKISKADDVNMETTTIFYADCEGFF